MCLDPHANFLQNGRSEPLLPRTGEFEERVSDLTLHTTPALRFLVFVAVEADLTCLRSCYNPLVPATYPILIHSGFCKILRDSPADLRARVRKTLLRLRDGQWG